MAALAIASATVVATTVATPQAVASPNDGGTGAPAPTATVTDATRSGDRSESEASGMAMEDEEHSHLDQPSGLSMQGGAVACDVEAARPWLSTTTPRLRARVSSQSGGLLTAHFEWGLVGQKATGSRSVSRTPSGSAAEITVPEGELREGQAYFWRVRAHDGVAYSPYSQPCEMVIDATAPHSPPTVSSTAYPPGKWTGGEGIPGDFTFDANGVDDVVRYLYSTVPPSLTTPAPADGLGGPATVEITPTSDGPYTLSVRSQDRAGNLSPITYYSFLVAGRTPAVSHWKFDEFDGTTTPDSSGNGHTASVAGTVQWSDGHNGDAPHFDGSTGHLTTDSAGVRTDSSFAVTAWVRLTDKERSRTAVSQDSAQSSGYHLHYSRDDDRWAFSLPSAYGGSSTTARALSIEPADATGHWTHLAGVYEAHRQRIILYVNGVEQSSTEVSSHWNATGSVRIGAAQSGGRASDFWAGAVDEVRVYERALAAAEVAEIFNQVVVKGHWGLEESADGTIPDESRWNHPGVVRGGATWREDDYMATTVLELDGRSGHVANLPAVVDTSQSFSVSVWVRSEDLGTSSQTAVSLGNGAQLQYRASSGRWAFVLPGSPEAGDPIVAESLRSAREGQWTHLVALYDSAERQAILHVDARLNKKVDHVYSTSSEDGIQIGRAESDASYWHGSVSDVRVFSGVLSQPRIADLAFPRRW
ncbi:LamG-like jellyroll fold domain-containing protein [Actinoalloteichus spitiensis]|uniref:LamG-like jellyroll fold domain-containing protein n=1 Tax=Actinoalloteichus spitiensis TaxID=252394 RepID=UPI000474A2E6|nr:LamG domain-containing protein [Actinoalloteichus spitiensis]